MLLGEGLSSLSASKFDPKVEVTVATPTAAGDFDDSRLGFRVVRQPNLFDLARLVNRADIVQLAGPCFLPLLLGWLFSKPVVVEHHGYAASCPNGLLFHEPTQTVCPGHFLAGHYRECCRCNAGTMGWLRSLRLLLLAFPRRWLCQRVAANTPISAHVQRRLDLHSSQVIYYGIPEDPAGAGLQIINSSKETSLCFAYVGRLVSLKGLPLILEAAKTLQEEGYNFRLKFIGDGSEQTLLKSMTAELGLARHVEFTGFLTGDAFRSAMNDVAVVLMPSVCEETAGLAAIEQMMRGRLVIASDIGGLGEVVGDGGLRFPPGQVHALAQRMRSALESPEIIVQYGIAARRRALDLFSEQRMVKEYFDLYRRVTGFDETDPKARHAL
jgi:glycosyltransferase involved in cell wall biosynthesis